MKGNQITIKDIAKILHISPSTVSRALKDHPDIGTETKKKVNELAKQLKYKPNAVALSLKNSKTYTIGVIIPEIVHYFFSSVISGIEDVAHEAGYNVMICQSNEKYIREVSNVQAMLSNRVEGIMVSISKETFDFEHLKNVEESGLPLVFFDRSPEGFNTDSVVIDDRKAAYKATKYLIETGCRKIAHLCAPQSIRIGSERFEGYKDALKEFDLSYYDSFVIQADSFSLACAATRKLMNSPLSPDGIFAVNDLTAIGAMKTLQDMHYRIPDDVAVMGFSAGRFSDLTTPTLSSVDQHGYEMGVKTTNILLKRITEPESGNGGETHYINTNLVIRDSTKKTKW